MFLQSLCVGLMSNILFSGVIFIYKQYYHKKYDSIIDRLNNIEKLIINQQLQKINNKNYYE